MMSLREQLDVEILRVETKIRDKIHIYVKV